MKIVLNSDKELVEEINNILDENVKQYGHKYCSSIDPKFATDNDICPCKNFLDSPKLDKCLCGKYIKTEL